MRFIVGVISDTHGLLRPEVVPMLIGVDHILHAGDVGNADILATLAEVAPVTAIRGNVDTHGPCAQLPAIEMVELSGKTLYMLHDLATIDISPSAAKVNAVIYGHSHQPSVQTRNGVLYLNPGSCGPRRFNLPVTIARLTVTGDSMSAEIIPLL